MSLRPEPHYTVQEYASLFQQGDEKGLAFFYHEFHPALTVFSSRWVDNRAIAEEIASDAFIRTWKLHWKLENYNSIRAYLYKIVLRDSRRALKREQKRREIHRQSQPSFVTNDTPFQHLVRSEVYRLIHSALKELSPGSRRVLAMHYLEGKTTGQIAKELQLSPSTIKTQKTKGLEALRKKILRPMLLIISLLLKIFFPL